MLSALRSSSKPLFSVLAALVLLFGVGWIGFLSWQREDRLATAWTKVPLQAGGPLPVLTGGDDSYYWRWVVETAVAEDSWRVRNTDLDNAPFGRAMRWSSIPLWWMRGWTVFFHITKGLPSREAAVLATELTGPFLHAATLLLLAGLAWRGRGPMAAIIVGLASIAPTLSYVEMSSGNVDHHGWQELAAGGMLLCLYLGGLGFIASEGSTIFPMPATRQIARRWFLLAGLFGALGVAISANLQFTLLTVTGCGALVAQWRISRGSTTSRLDSALWRDWALVGGGTILLLFLFENAPDRLLSRHLEANHPFFGFAWIAGGMVLWETRPEAGGWSAVGRHPFRILFWMGLLSLPFIALIFGGADWHLFRDLELSRLHEDVEELMPAWSIYDLKTINGWWLYLSSTGFAVLALGAGIWLWTRSRQNLGAPSLWLFAPILLPMFFLLVAHTFAQYRWITLLSLGALPVWLWVWDGSARTGAPWTWRAGSFVLCSSAALAGVIGAVQKQPSMGELVGTIQAAEIFRAAGNAMVRQSGQEHPIIMGDTAFNQMVFVSPVHYVGTIYWENADGLRDLLHFSIAQTEEEFREILDRRKVQYIAVRPSPSLIMRGAWARYGSYDLARMQKAFAWKVCKPGEKLPPWLHECTQEIEPRLKQLPMRVFRYTGSTL